MNFTVAKKDIAERLQSLIGIIPTRANMMILSNFVLEANKETGLLTFTATDLNIMARIEVAATVEEGGSLLVSAKHISDIIRDFPDSDIHFNTSDDHLFVKCGNFNFQISYTDPALFPVTNKINSESEFNIAASQFKKIIANSLFCISSDTSNPMSICTGAYVKIEDHLLTVAATDTRRIAEVKCKTDFTLDIPYEVVIPPKALQYIDKSITNETEFVTIKYDEHRVSFNLPGIELITNKYDGRFPTYTVAFKNPPNYTLILDKNVLKNAINCVAHLSEDDDRLIKITLERSAVKVESIISEQGTGKGVIEEFNYDGPECFFALNSRYILSFINVIETNEIVIKFRSTEEPFWIYNNEDYQDIELRFVVMPMRMNR